MSQLSAFSSPPTVYLSIPNPESMKPPTADGVKLVPISRCDASLWLPEHDQSVFFE